MCIERSDGDPDCQTQIAVGRNILVGEPERAPVLNFQSVTPWCT